MQSKKTKLAAIKHRFNQEIKFLYCEEIFEQKSIWNVQIIVVICVKKGVL